MRLCLLTKVGFDAFEKERAKVCCRGFTLYKHNVWIPRLKPRFGDYSHLGLNFKSTTQTCYNVRFTMIDLKAKSGKNKFSVGDAMATTYSDGTTKLEPGAQLCPAPRSVAPWTDPAKLSAMRVEAATGTGVPLDQFGYVKAGKLWVPCMVESLVPKTNGNSADQEVELILLGPSETVKIKKPLSEVRFVFESNTLLDGEATVLTPEEELIEKESWSKLKDPKRIVDELNKRRAEQNRPAHGCIFASRRPSG